MTKSVGTRWRAASRSKIWSIRSRRLSEPIRAAASAWTSKPIGSAVADATARSHHLADTTNILDRHFEIAGDIAIARHI